MIVTCHHSRPVRGFLASSFCPSVWCLVFLLGVCGHVIGQEVESGGPFAGQGMLVGEPTASSVLVQLRLTRTEHPVEGVLAGEEGRVEFRLFAIDPKRGDSRPVGEAVVISAESESDCIARTRFEGLAPGTRYVCRSRLSVRDGLWRRGPQATFRTLPGGDQSAASEFVVVTGMNYDKFHKAEGETGGRVVDGRQVGYPALATIKRLEPDFFVGTGDNVYYDSPFETRAKTLDEMRHKWHQQFAQQGYIDLFAHVPTFWEVDDHDYRRNDCDNSGDYVPGVDLAKRVQLEQLPYGLGDDAVTGYRTHRIGKDLQIWLTENRWYRSDNQSPDGPDKTIWGKAQREWLQRTLLESDATFKVLISPTPMIGPDDAYKRDNHANLEGFRTERDAFFSWLVDHDLVGDRFLIVCGDRHWQYHSRSPLGIDEFSCGALVDANARLGRKPGDPKSTDPEGEIEQPYLQPKASGGFLWLRCEPAESGQPPRLRVRWYDEQGEELHETVRE